MLPIVYAIQQIITLTMALEFLNQTNSNNKNNNNNGNLCSARVRCKIKAINTTKKVFYT